MMTHHGIVLAIGMPGPLEVILILVVILVLFGAKRLPELARSLGRSLGEFKKGRQEGERSLSELDDEQPPKRLDGDAKQGEE
jgi:sec-independent protein translocase protein TatA